MNLLSTTALAKKLEISPKELFRRLLALNLIQKESESWALTLEGQQKGGAYKVSKQYGQYIVWPEAIDICLVPTAEANGPIERLTQTAEQNGPVKLLTATALGGEFELSANKTNFILSELGWVKKGLKGWLITDQGLKQGGLQSEDQKSGIPYVRWPEAIAQSKALTETIAQVKGTDIKETAIKATDNAPILKSTAQTEEIGFRDKFKAEHRSADGHFVRSKAEMLIDNWLYMAEIVHAYERKLPIEEDVYSDFYIPTGRVYIEYWGYENDPKYLARKQNKIELYKKYDFNLIELQDKDVQNLDDVLPRLLLKHGVRAY